MHPKRDKSEGSRFARRVQERQGTVDSLKSSVRRGTPKNLQFDRLLKRSKYELPFHIQGRVSMFLMPKNVIDKHLDVFDKNRYIDFDRVSAYADYQTGCIETDGEPSYTGVLTACRYEGEQVWYLIDGQHRILGIEDLILERGYSDVFEDFLIEIHVINVKTEDDIRVEFENINKSVPVPPSVLQPNQIVDDAIEILCTKYLKPFTISVRARRPKIYGDGFKDYLIEQKVVDTLYIETAEELASLIVRTDNIIKSYGVPKLVRMIKGNDKERERIEKFYEKCAKENKMFLSIFKARNPDKRGIWMNIMENLPQKGKEREKEE